MIITWTVAWTWRLVHSWWSELLSSDPSLSIQLHEQMSKQWQHPGAELACNLFFSSGWLLLALGRQTLVVWSKALSFMRPPLQPFPPLRPPLLAPTSPLLVCMLTPLLLLNSNTLFCWSSTSSPLPSFPHQPAFLYESLFLEASIWRMCCDCSGLENTDVPFVAWPVVIRYFSV